MLCNTVLTRTPRGRKFVPHVDTHTHTGCKILLPHCSPWSRSWELTLILTLGFTQSGVATGSAVIRCSKYIQPFGAFPFPAQLQNLVLVTLLTMLDKYL
jgi:hypothetical protein